jgi:hypothetical protein
MIVYILFILGSIYGFYETISFRKRRVFYQECWIEVKGYVSKIETNFDEEKLIIEFESKKGEKISKQPKHYNYNDFKPPSKDALVYVLYNPNNPNDFILKSALTQNYFYWNILINSIMLLIGLLGIIYSLFKI